jgi:uncharacterized protein YjbI with pentapeptide repeats
MRGANLSDADLSRANLSGADLGGVFLGGARNMTQEQLDVACGTGAKLPARLTLKPCPEPAPVPVRP